MKKSTSISLLILFSVFLFACKKEPGIGGTSTIKGKIYGYEYNSTYTVKSDSGYVARQDVYIVYGDDATYGDNQKTNYDGTYEFKYLQKGSYKIYTYSKDSTIKVNTFRMKTIIQSTEITQKNQTIEIPNLVVLK